MEQDNGRLDASKAGDARTPSARTLHGLDWFNFFLADVQTGIGPFLAIYLAGYGWNQERVGIALAVGGIAGILTQTPAGAVVDRLRSKRALIATGIVALAVGALLIALAPTFWSVMSAQVLIGGTSSIFGPAICAISLGIVGRRLFDRRQGRNQAFNSAGNAMAAISMGLLGYFISNRSISSSWWPVRSRLSSRFSWSGPLRSITSWRGVRRKAAKLPSPSRRTHCSRIGRCSSSSSVP
jgi:MFS family permease